MLYACNGGEVVSDMVIELICIASMEIILLSPSLVVISKSFALIPRGLGFLLFFDLHVCVQTSAQLTIGRLRVACSINDMVVSLLPLCITDRFDWVQRGILSLLWNCILRKIIFRNHVLRGVLVWLAILCLGHNVQLPGTGEGGIHKLYLLLLEALGVH